MARINGKKGGRPPGRRNAATLQRERVAMEVRQRIMRIAQRILDSQISLAVGQQFLYKIEKTPVKGPKGGTSYQKSKPILVTNPAEIEAYLDGEFGDGDSVNDPHDPAADYYFITTKPPSNEAISSLMDRALGKVKDPQPIDPEDGGGHAPSTINIFIAGKSSQVSALPSGTRKIVVPVDDVSGGGR